jgi:hypothetical protein
VLISLLRGATPLLREIQTIEVGEHMGIQLKKDTKFSFPPQGSFIPQQNGKTYGVRMLCPKLISSFGP